MHARYSVNNPRSVGYRQVRNELSSGFQVKATNMSGIRGAGRHLRVSLAAASVSHLKTAGECS
jgi:hypothetical protein